MAQGRIDSPPASAQKIDRARQMLSQLIPSDRTAALRQVFGKRKPPAGLVGISLLDACLLIDQAKRRGAR